MKARILYLGQNDDGIHFPPAFKLFKTDDPKEAKGSSLVTSGMV